MKRTVPDQARPSPKFRVVRIARAKPRPAPLPKGRHRLATRREQRRAAERELQRTAERDGWRVVGERKLGYLFPDGIAAVPMSGWTDLVSEAVAGHLFDAIAQVAAERERCARDPERDLARARTITLEMLLSVLVCWGQSTIASEMHDSFEWNGKAPSSSAFCQQWKKLSDEAMPLLLRTFLARFLVVPYLGTCRLLAYGRTGMRVPETGEESTRVRSNQSDAHHDELHPTCEYDILRHTFEDVVFQGAKKSNEPAALCQLVDRTFPGLGPDGTPLRALWVADRNYLASDVVCHMEESDSALVIRANDERAVRFLGYEPEGDLD